MAVISNVNCSKLEKELIDRYNTLTKILFGRELKNSKEGIKNGFHWTRPENYRWIDSADLSLAIGDFKVILAEILKIK